MAILNSNERFAINHNKQPLKAVKTSRTLMDSSQENQYTREPGAGVFFRQAVGFLARTAIIKY